ncbi:MAG TPA: zinc metallopeptidase [Clostridia bacterium]|nr:zinc metallopeptidase [Clostridia bacterium]
MDQLYLLIILIFLLSMWASNNVQRSFIKYSKVPNDRNLSGAEAARILVQRNNLNVNIERSQGGMLSDHYDPRTNTVRLSPEVFDGRSISSLSVASHEVGHAIQHAYGYKPLEFRTSFFPIASFASKTWTLFFFMGLFFYSGTNFFINIAIGLFAAGLLFQLLTLPVEFDASRRALVQMTDQGLLGTSEIPGARAVLKSAALTYVMAALMGVANLLRLLSLRGRRS